MPGDVGFTSVADHGPTRSPEVPLSSPSLPTRPWRLRFVIPDEPGRLAAAASALAELGVNILNLDVQVVGPGQVLDEATVALPMWIDVPAVEYALRSAGASEVWATPVPMHDVVDLPTRTLRLAAAGRLADGPPQLTDVLSQLLTAELVWVQPPLPEARRSEMVEPTFDQQYIKRLPASSPAWTMAVPDPTAPRDRVFVAARRFAPFTLADATRAAALLSACAPSVPDRRRVTADTCISLRPLRRSQRPEILAMHERCSPSTRYRRYFSSMAGVRTDIIDALLEPDDGRISIGAWSGDQLVGIGNGCPTEDGSPTMELAVLVADEHQNRGIGTLLLSEMVIEATHRDVRDFAVIMLPDNRAMARVTRRVAGAVTSSTDGDTVTLRFAVE